MAAKKDTIDVWFDYNVNLDTRTLLLADDISPSNPDGVGDEMANFFIKGLHLLESKNGEPITIIMRSLGGELHAGMAIYDAIKLAHSHITIDVYGASMSMAAIILQAGDTRRMSPNALLMLHDGAWGMDSSPRTFENWARVSKQIRRQTYEILADKTTKSWRYWEGRCADDYILAPELALKEKLIDSIIGTGE